MSATNADVVGAQFETVRPRLQELFETTSLVTGMIKKSSESHRVSAWTGNDGAGHALRVPLLRYVGGDYGTFDYDEGDLGSGSSAKIDYMHFGYFPDKYAVEISSLEKEATASNAQATVDIFKFHMKRSIKEYQNYYETGFFGDSTGVLATGLGTGSPSSPNPTYNLEANFGAQRLRYGQPVDVYRAGLDLKMNAATVRVASYDLVNKTVTLSGTVSGGVANTDRLAFTGMTATLAAGSWRNGLYNFNSSASSGYTGGLNRATVVELVTPTIAAGTNPLVPAHGLLLNDQIIQRRDEDAVKGMIGIAHQAQRAAVYFTGIAISEWHRGPSDKMIDIVPKDIAQSTTFTFCGITHYVSKRQDRSRIDWIIPKNWGRALLHDLKFHEVEGRRIFELRSSTTGNVKAGMVFYMIGTDQLYNVDPGAAGTISGLTLPNGY